MKNQRVNKEGLLVKAHLIEEPFKILNQKSNIFGKPFPCRLMEKANKSDKEQINPKKDIFVEIKANSVEKKSISTKMSP